MDSPMEPITHDGDDVVYPCKGCGEILEEGKAFELAGNRWHIDCFRCNTCNTLLDSDANLLLLGDGSLICNNCTYSCSACGNKIEDLAILTGDQAFCAACFKCRNCKKKIDNLRYARTSQGIFCMQCHESLMARRKKKSKSGGTTRTPSSANSNGTPVEKHLPPVPPSTINTAAIPGSADVDSPASGSNYTLTPTTDSTPGLSKPKTRKDAGYVDLNAAVIQDKFDQVRAAESSGSYGQSPTEAGRVDDDFNIPIGLQLQHPQVGAVEGFRGDDFKDLVAGSSVSRSVSNDRSNRAAMYSPHILYQEKGRQPSNEVVDTVKRRDGSGRSTPQQEPASPALGSVLNKHRGQPSQSSEYSNNSSAFKLQDVPTDRNSKGSNKDSPGQAQAAQDTSSLLEQSVFPTPPDRDPSQTARRKASFRRSPLGVPETWEPTSSPDLSTQAGSKAIIHRKEVPRGDSDVEDGSRRAPISAGEPGVPSPLFDGRREPPPRSQSRPNINNHKEDDGSFTAPREPPPTPQPQAQSSASTQSQHKPNASLSSIQSERFQTKDQTSPLLQSAGEFPMEDEMGRIIRSDADPPGLLRRVSKAVKHNRTQSDKALNPGLSPKTANWPKNARNGSMDISSPIIQKIEGDEDAGVLKGKLWEAQRKIAELEADKLSLHDKINGTEEIRQANTELREKRSTMAFLDTQREMVVRELEVMTEHLAKAKDSNKPINLDELKVEACADLARALKKLEESLGSQIEELIRQKNDLLTDLSNLVRMKDKGMAEYESLENKNAQLMQLHESLVQNIQALYRQGKIPGPAPNGLGISPGPGEWRPRVDSISDNRSAASSEAGYSVLSGETEVEGAPKVIDIRKGVPAKKFNWKKGGSSMGKNITRGLKGAFGGAQSTPLREEQFAEGIPYGSMEAGEAPTMGNVPARMLDKDRRNWNFPNQAQPGKPGTPAREIREQPVATLPAESSLFGSDLTARADFERRIIPSIVTRCIEEVEARGMDVEGVYRKSGSSSQVRSIQQGFEKDFASFSINDPDLDIHAVTSAVKQYLRKLPLPLITYDAYDRLIEAADIPDSDDKVRVFVKIVDSLPRTHRDTLEFLVFHLARVMRREPINLMTSTNLAVVFAPTIMRPRAADRELADMESARSSVEFLIKNNNAVFSGPMSD